MTQVFKNNAYASLAAELSAVGTLATLAAGQGVNFQYETAVTGLRTEAGRISGVATSRGEVKADVYLVALGSYSPALVKPLGLNLPVYPVKGYSITVPIAEASTVVS